MMEPLRAGTVVFSKARWYYQIPLVVMTTLIGQPTRRPHCYVVVVDQDHPDDTLRGLDSGCGSDGDTPAVTDCTEDLDEPEDEVEFFYLPVSEAWPGQMFYEANHVTARYSYLNYLAVALWHWHIRIPRLRWWFHSRSRGHCSAYIAMLYDNLGQDPFPDQYPCEVSPGDVRRAAERLDRRAAGQASVGQALAA